MVVRRTPGDLTRRRESNVLHPAGGMATPALEATPAKSGRLLYGWVAGDSAIGRNPSSVGKWMIWTSSGALSWRAFSDRTLMTAQSRSAIVHSNQLVTTSAC